MYKLVFSKYFERKRRKIKKQNLLVSLEIVSTLEALSFDPKSGHLKSHKVTTPKFGECFSSSVTGDLRIIWNYNKGEVRVLDILDLGGHSGKGKVY